MNVGGVSVTTSGGTPLLVVGLFFSVALATVLGGVLVVRIGRGYRRTGSRHLLALGVGFLFVVPVPKLLNLSLSTGTALSYDAIALGASVAQLLGFAVILYAIYDT
ncbi:DUF7521 family protein [Salarchaeum japonicum]|uniref:Uncharacterized protein n=1 Tax=Salarchaeum japonicum TaxID=555573 RepID=A0AAV3T3X5_9EURY|nr:hypothetical protein [Salarchaeum japonicum]